MSRGNCLGHLKNIMFSSAALGSISPTVPFVLFSHTVVRSKSTCAFSPTGSYSGGTSSQYRCRRRRPAWRDTLIAPMFSSTYASSFSDVGEGADVQEGNAVEKEHAFIPWPSACSSASCEGAGALQGPPQDSISPIEEIIVNSDKDSCGDEIFHFKAQYPNLAPGRILRRLQRNDIDSLVTLALEEFCDEYVDHSVPPTTGLEHIARVWMMIWESAGAEDGLDEAGAERLMTRVEIEWMYAVIRWGFSERLNISERGEDHRITSSSWSPGVGLAAGSEKSGTNKLRFEGSVFCVSDEEWTKRVDTQGSLLAVAEVSLQVPNGNRALPVPLPIWLKKLLSWPRPLVPYISNVLVEPGARRQGLAKMLMARCEQQALHWGYSKVFLHVDLCYSPAVRLYESLGYEPVSDDPVYECNGEPHLRYMKKELR